MLSLSLPLGQGLLEWVAVSHIPLLELPIQSPVQHSCWAGFINFLLLLGHLCSPSLGDPSAWVLVSSPWARPALNLNKSILVLMSNFSFLTPGHLHYCSLKPSQRKKLSQLIHFLIHSSSLWWISFPKMKLSKITVCAVMALTQPRLCPLTILPPQWLILE